MSRKQGLNKSMSEINDIFSALNTLSEKDKIPLFMGSSGMVAKTPIYSNHPTDGDFSVIGE